jgi:NifU-like protein involved in Fe-S cluster formation
VSDSIPKNRQTSLAERDKNLEQHKRQATRITTMAATATATPSAEEAGPLYIDTQHDDMVHDAQLDYYGCKLATSSSGRKYFVPTLKKSATNQK